MTGFFFFYNEIHVPFFHILFVLNFAHNNEPFISILKAFEAATKGGARATVQSTWRKIQDNQLKLSLVIFRSIVLGIRYFHKTEWNQPQIVVTFPILK